MTEAEWMESVAARLNESLAKQCVGSVQAVCKKRLAYRFEIASYEPSGSASPSKPVSYETDLLVFENKEGGNWTPRVVVEGKLAWITTHDALTYSAKAATHVQVHPYLRYGILVGKQQGVAERLVRHGAHFDFMAAWKLERASAAEWKAFLDVIEDEIESSRQLQKFISLNRSREKERYGLIRRKLLFEA